MRVYEVWVSPTETALIHEDDTNYPPKTVEGKRMRLVASFTTRTWAQAKRAYEAILWGS